MSNEASRTLQDLPYFSEVRKKMNSTKNYATSSRTYPGYPIVCNGSWYFTDSHMYDMCCTPLGRLMLKNEDCLPYAIRTESSYTEKSVPKVSVGHIILFLCLFLVVLAILYECYKRIFYTRSSNFTNIQLTQILPKSTFGTRKFEVLSWFQA